MADMASSAAAAATTPPVFRKDDSVLDDLKKRICEKAKILFNVAEPFVAVCQLTKGDFIQFIDPQTTVTVTPVAKDLLSYVPDHCRLSQLSLLEDVKISNSIILKNLLFIRLGTLVDLLNQGELLIRDDKLEAVRLTSRQLIESVGVCCASGHSGLVANLVVILKNPEAYDLEMEALEKSATTVNTKKRKTRDNDGESSTSYLGGWFNWALARDSFPPQQK